MPYSPEPLVRGSHLKEDLRALEALGARPAARIRASLKPDSLRAIEEATRIDYLPLAYNIEMADAVYAQASGAGSRLWARTSLLSSLGGLFQPLFEAATALFHPAPPLFYKYIPRGWLLSYRGCGEFSVEEPSPGRTLLIGNGLAPAMFCDSYLTAVCGTFEAVFSLTEFAGGANCVSQDKDRLSATWEAEWRPLTDGSR